jgi:plasmid stabilization system protein ParE
MNVTFHPDARDDLDRVFAWIAKDNPRAACAMVARIEAKVMQPAAPELAHMGLPQVARTSVWGASVRFVV